MQGEFRKMGLNFNLERFSQKIGIYALLKGDCGSKGQKNVKNRQNFYLWRAKI